MPIASNLFRVFGQPRLYRTLELTEIVLEAVPDGALAERESVIGDWSKIELTQTHGRPTGFVRTLYLDPLPPAHANPFPQFPPMTFVVSVKRLREDKRGGRRRTVGDLALYYDGQLLTSVSGQVLEPHGPGNNGPAGSAADLRIEAGSYRIVIHAGTKYATYRYETNGNRPRPGIGVYDGDTAPRSAILLHPGGGFLSSEGCLNVTPPTPGHNDDMSLDKSIAKTVALIDLMHATLGDERFPREAGKFVKDTYLVIEGEPEPRGGRGLSRALLAANRERTPMTLDKRSPPDLSREDPSDLYHTLVELAIDSRDDVEAGVSAFEHMIEPNRPNLAAIRRGDGATIWRPWIILCSNAALVADPQRRAALLARLARIGRAIDAAGIGMDAAPDGEPALVTAARADADAAISLLHQLGADLEVRNQRGHTALHEAAVNASAASFDVLLKLGADRSAQVIKGRELVAVEAADTATPELAAGANVGDALDTALSNSASEMRRSSVEAMRRRLAQP